MKFWKAAGREIMLLLVLAACVPEKKPDPPPRFDITLEPSQIAANLYTPPARPELISEVMPTTAGPSEPTALPTQPRPTATATVVQLPTATETPLPTEPPEQTAEPQIIPTSNSEALRAMQDNKTLLVSFEMGGECFLANDYTPFKLMVLNLASEPIYFYLKGRWLLSINNSSLGPNLASLAPTLREDFLEIAPNATYERGEEDIGLWVLSLGPDSGIPFTPTGIGLPAGEYWVTFAYNNDQDGLHKQPGGSYLIPEAAWRGTAVSFEVRFKIVDDLSNC
jgi:hypothetical protein